MQFDDESNSEFSLVVSGKASVVYCSFFLVMERRHDLTVRAIRTFLSPCIKLHKDMLVVDMPIARDPAVNSEILIIQQAELKVMRKEQTHIDQLLRQFDPNASKTDSLSKKLVCFGET